jgi:hypothetical protein
MLKILAVLALALAVFPVQTYAQANKAKEEAKSDKPSPPVPAVVPKQTSSQTSQPAHQERIDADVRGISTPAKDGYDKAAFWATIALVVAGFSGIGVGVCTLSILNRQTKATEDAAKAALLQAKHMETTQRAWLLINFVSMKDRELKDGEVVACRWAIKNVGATPAILLESKARFHAVRLYDEMPEDPVKTLPAIPDYGSPITINERLLAPQDSIGYFTKWERNVDGTFSEFAFPAQANEVWMVVAYGYVKYRDIFGGERESRSCDFTCIGRSNNIPMEFIPHPKVPTAYNRCT